MDVKTDEKSIFSLCNSLNAVAGGLRYEGKKEQHIAELLLKAQVTITMLYDENQSLRKEREGNE